VTGSGMGALPQLDPHCQNFHLGHDYGKCITAYARQCIAVAYPCL